MFDTSLLALLRMTGYVACSWKQEVLDSVFTMQLGREGLAYFITKYHLSPEYGHLWQEQKPRRVAPSFCVAVADMAHEEHQQDCQVHSLPNFEEHAWDGSS